MTFDVPFGEWLPAAPSFKNPGCVVANNVIPTPGGYGPVLGPLAMSQTISQPCRGAALFFQIGGNDVVVSGGATALYINVNGTTTATTGLTTIGTGESWDFAQFNDLIFATSIANNPKYLDDIDTDTSWSDLPGSPPKARYCERVEEFLMLGNVENVPNRIHWSSFNSPATSWAADRLTQAGYADLPRKFGPVRRIVGGRYPMVFQERGVSRLDYVGPPVIWRASEVEQSRGALAPFSVVPIGFVTYFLAQDGFWRTDGSSFDPVGTQRVNRWFLETADADQVQQTHGAVDWENECVLWAFKSSGSTVFDRLIRYSWAENRWASGVTTVGRLVEAAVGGYTLEQIGALYASIEDVPVSLDDERWRSRVRVLAAYVDGASTSDLSSFNGPTLAAQVETGEFQPSPGERAMVTGARILADGGQHFTAAAAVSQNDRSEAYSADAAPGVDGFCPLRANGQVVRLVARAPAGSEWRDLQGAQVRWRGAGRR